MNVTEEKMVHCVCTNNVSGVNMSNRREEAQPGESPI